MTPVDGAIVLVYLAGIVAIGILFRGRQENVRDYFTGHRGFRGAAGLALVGLSIGATYFSGLSFVMYPSIVYTHGVTVLASLVCFPAAYLVLRHWFLPRYFAHAPGSPYEIVERRFGRPTRLTTSVLFVLLRLCWMAALIYAPVLVVMAAGGLAAEWFWPLVLLVGLSSTVYTVVGGIRGVIITDALQFLLILTVLLVTIAYVALQIPLSFGELREYLRVNSNLLTLNWSPDPTVVITVWAMGIGGSLQNLGSFMADQMSLQRYLAAGSATAATRAFGTGMLATPLVLVLLAAVGITLGAWYSFHPDPALPTSADKVFPHFVATQLPAGFTGLVVAAILAATMSSVTSGINALSGSLLSDFGDLGRNMDPARLLRLARLTSAALGLLATVSAGFMRNLGSIFDIMNIFFGVFLGPLLGCMACAVSGLRLKGFAVMSGLVCGCIAGVLVVHLPIADLWVTAVSSLVTITVAWMLSREAKRTLAARAERTSRASSRV